MKIFKQILSNPADFPPPLKAKMHAAKIATAAAVILAVIGGIAYRYAPLVAVGSTSFTCADLAAVTNFSARINEISGNEINVKLPPVSRKQVFKQMAITAMEKGLLEKVKAPGVNRADVMKLALDTTMAIDGRTDTPNPYRGEFVRLQKTLGDDRFYKLIAEPPVIRKRFAGWYAENDPQKKVAETALETAKRDGIVAAGQSVKIPAKEMHIAWTPYSLLLYPLLKQAAAGTVIDKWVEDAAGYNIIKTNQVTEQQATVTAVTVPHSPLKRFVLAELKAKGVPVEDHVLAPYKLADLDR